MGSVHPISILGKAPAQGPTCINHAFYLCISQCFDIWSLADNGEGDPPRAGYLLEIANNSKQLLYASQPIQSPFPHTSLPLYLAFILWVTIHQL